MVSSVEDASIAVSNQEQDEIGADYHQPEEQARIGSPVRAIRTESTSAMAIATRRLPFSSDRVITPVSES